jgi:hypothetical protein
MNQHNDHHNLLLLIFSIFIGSVSILLKIKPYLDLIFILVAITGALISLVINLKKLFRKQG